MLNSHCLHPIKRGKTAISRVAGMTTISSASSPLYVLSDQAEEAVPPHPCWPAAIVHFLYPKSWGCPASAVSWLSHAHLAACPVTLPATISSHLVLLILTQSYQPPLDILPTPPPNVPETGSSSFELASGEASGEAHKEASTGTCIILVCDYI